MVGVTRTGGQGAKRTVTTTGRRTTTTTARRRVAPREEGSSWRVLGFVGKVALVSSFAIALVAGLLYVRLLQGPIALSFLVQPIQRALSEELSSVRLHLE